jgi:hypothetical protein
MSKILANQIANYGDNSPVEVKEGVNIPAGKPLQAAGISGSNGQVLTSTGTSITWTTPFNGNYNSLTNLPSIPAPQVRADWNAVGTIAEILNKPIIPAQPSVSVVTPSANGNLTYNQGNGLFTFTPPDLSGYALASSIANAANWDTAYSWGDHAAAGYATTIQLNTAIANSSDWDTAYSWGDHAAVGYLTAYTETDPVFSASPAFGILSGDITNWDTAYGWGDHSAQGYLTSLAVEDLSNVDITGGLADQQILKWDSTSSSWKPANDLVGGQSAIELSDLSVSTNPAGSPSLSYNNTNGVFTYTPPDLSPYLTSFTETDPVFSAHVASNILQQNITNWNTAYSWGDHSTAGYATTTQLNTAVANSSNWDTAYSWGDHANAGYLTSLGDAAGVTAAKISNWDTAYGWGDHSTEGYLTTVALNGVSDVTITTPSSGEVLTYNGSGWVNSAPTGGGGGANVTISDTAPGSPTAGDLWWESDKGRLKIYYNDTDSSQWVDASPPLSNPLSPVAVGYINMNGTSPTWSGTAGYTVTGTQPGGAGTDYVYTLTFPSAYLARTNYVVQATYDGTNYISSNGCELAVARGTASVVFTPRRLDGQPLNQGEIMVTITNL